MFLGSFRKIHVPLWCGRQARKNRKSTNRVSFVIGQCGDVLIWKRECMHQTWLFKLELILSHIQGGCIWKVWRNFYQSGTQLLACLANISQLTIAVLSHSVEKWWVGHISRSRFTLGQWVDGIKIQPPFYTMIWKINSSRSRSSSVIESLSLMREAWVQSLSKALTHTCFWGHISMVPQLA